MKRLKTFFLYALAIAAFWFLSDILIYMAVNASYSHIESRVMVDVPNINISDSKATYINGYIKGNIYNNSDETINDKYIKIDLYSPRDVLLGTKYIKLENLEAQKTMDIEMWFKYTDVEYCNITLTDKDVATTEDQFVSDETKFYIVAGTILFLYFI